MTAPSLMMVLVYAPIDAAKSCGFAGSFEAPHELMLVSEAVGILPFEGDMKDAQARLKPEVEACGCKFDAVVRCYSDGPGYIGTMIAYRVTAPSMKVARDLPGFGAFYHIGHEEYFPLLDMEKMQAECLRWRDSVCEYKMPRGTPPPRYNDAGVAIFSMIPKGQLGTAIFLEDAPDVWYAVMGRDSTKADEAMAAVMALRG